MFDISEELAALMETNEGEGRGRRRHAHGPA